MRDGLDDERDPAPIGCPAWRVAGHGLTVAKRKEREESNVCSILWHTRFMAIVPAEPEPRHVWVKGASDYGPTRPGLILNWQYAPVHNATTPSWVALVLVAPFPDAALIEWVSADRLIGIRDLHPPMDTDSPRRRHVWVDGSGGYRRPGLVISWRRNGGGWEAYVAIGSDGSVLLTWEPANQLHPVTDDRPASLTPRPPEERR